MDFPHTMTTTHSATVVAPAAAHTEALWQVELFSSPLPPLSDDARDVSARAAYQDALYGRAVLLDLRPEQTRARDGRLGGLDVVELRPGLDLSALSAAPIVHLVGDGLEPAEFAGFDPGHPRVHRVVGGFAAWRAAGLPVLTS